MDCVVILFRLQCKWKWEIVRILQLGSAFGRLPSDSNFPFYGQSERVGATTFLAFWQSVPHKLPPAGVIGIE
jgi:hypothetical protein